MMQDRIGIPSCFSSGEKPTDNGSAAVTRSGQSLSMSTYRAKIADHYGLVTVTWSRNLLLHCLSVSVEGAESQFTCKVELKPWYFWRKQGSKCFLVDDKPIDIFWDLRAAKFNGETEPSSEYYVAVVCDEEIVLLLGDLKKDAYRKTGCRPALTDPILVSKKEHIYGKSKFFTKLKVHEKGRFHEILIECKSRGDNNSRNMSNSNSFSVTDAEMEMRIDGLVVIDVKHLQWKFRGNESVYVDKVRLDVSWDVHDWIFSPGLRHALFTIKPILPSLSTPSSPPLSSLASTPLSSQTGSSGSVEGWNAGGSSEFCLFLYAWKAE